MNKKHFECCKYYRKDRKKSEKLWFISNFRNLIIWQMKRQKKEIQLKITSQLGILKLLVIRRFRAQSTNFSSTNFMGSKSGNFIFIDKYLDSWWTIRYNLNIPVFPASQVLHLTIQSEHQTPVTQFISYSVADSLRSISRSSTIHLPSSCP